ncbi:MAG: transposase [Sphingomonadales bacterium]|nr:MAG: transposase [Sphingomonadales bacterium]
MPRVIELAESATCSLAECVANLKERGFDPRDEDSLHHAARQLARLGNDRAFLGDMLIAELAARHREDDGRNFYGPQVVMLAPPDGGDFFMRANLWPSADEHMMRASGASSFVYGFAHDHNFDFLTLGYFGPGYWSDYYEYDFEGVTGWQGEPVDLRFVERSRLEEGKIMHYRAHRDVHAQLPADALSVSINVMHSGGAQGWMDQYSFDVENRRIGRIVSHGSSEVFMRVAVGLGNADATDLAAEFGRHHPSDRMRLAAWGALAAAAEDAAGRDRVWRDAERCGSRLVAAEAGAKRRALEPAI